MARFAVLHCLASFVKLALFSAIPTIPLSIAKPCMTHGGDTRSSRGLHSSGVSDGFARGLHSSGDEIYGFTIHRHLICHFLRLMRTLVILVLLGDFFFPSATASWSWIWSPAFQPFCCLQQMNKFIPLLELLQVEEGWWGCCLVGAVCHAMIDESRTFWEERGICQ